MTLAGLTTSALLALGSQWAVIDLPYPEVTGSETAAPVIDVRISEAVANYARARSGTAPRKHEMAAVRVDADTASIRLTMGDRSEIVILTRVKNEWRVVQALSEAREY